MNRTHKHRQPRGKLIIVPGQDWVPPDAVGDPKKESWWRQNVFDRIRKHLYMDWATAEEDMSVLFGSFRPELIRQAIQQRWNLIPLLVRGSGLTTPWILQPALAVLSNNSVLILTLLRGTDGKGPKMLREAIRKHHPEIAQYFDTEEGWSWFDQNCYNLAKWLYDTAKLRGTWWYPDPGVPLTLPPDVVDVKDQ